MGDTYEQTQVEVAPPWLQNAAGRAWLGAFGAQKDDLVDLADQAVKARFPLICPSDALPLIAEERGLPQGVSEPEANFRQRLAHAWDSWLWAGSPYGLLRAMQLAGFPTVRLQCQSGVQWTLGAGGTPGHLQRMPITGALGGSPQRWSDIAVLIPKPWPSWWGTTAPADGSAEQRTAAFLVSRWKAAHNRCVALKVIDGLTWDSGIHWDDGSQWDSGSVTTWTPPAN